MKDYSLDKLTVCEECGCVFDYQYAMKYRESQNQPYISVCPACKHEYELPNKLIK